MKGQEFGLGIIKLQAILRHPWLNVSDACFKFVACKDESMRVVGFITRQI